MKAPLTAAAAALLLLFILSVVLPLQVLPDLWSRDPDLAAKILFELRLPRAILALAYGAVLGSAGAAIQALFANPLASPDVTGVTGGSALGAVVSAYLLGTKGDLGVMAGGIAGALLALLCLLALAGRNAGVATLLLSGLAISAATGAATALALALAPSPFAFYDAYDWLMGSLVDRSLPQAVFVAVPAAVTLLLLRRDAPALDALALGEESAAAMGHRPDRLRVRVVIVSALGVGAAVAVCGAVGFVGLVAPIFARRLTGGHPGRAILPAALIGALLLVAADLAVRLAPAGRPLPLGVLTSLLGAPFFLWLVARMRWRWAA